jgi:hypothetical protein
MKKRLSEGESSHRMPRRTFLSGAGAAVGAATAFGGKPACSNFDYSGPLSEAVLMGNLAVRYPNRLLLWDGEKMEVTNDPDANAYVRREYRAGWSLTE